MILDELVSWAFGQGVAVGVLLWFMFRNEKKMERLISVVERLCKEKT